MEGLVLAIGNFDGVHKGHKKIIQETKHLAKELGLENNWGLMYFDPHPRMFLKNHDNFLLTSKEEKFNLLKKLLVPIIIALPFNEIYHLSAEQFFFDILIKKYNVKGMVTGDNFNFGKGRSGNIGVLSSMALRSGIKYVCVKEEKYNENISYSSSNVRKFINQGNIVLANDLLGHGFKIKSCVIHGNKLGRTLGFPTANLFIDNYVSPKYGVYIVFAYIEGKKYRAMSNFGLRPTATKEKIEVLEVHIFDFDGDLYDKIIEVEFIDFIRDEKKFESLDQLKKQISKDKKLALDYFKKLET